MLLDFPFSSKWLQVLSHAPLYIFSKALGKHSCSDLTIYGNAGFREGFTVNFVHKWVYLDPNKREDRGH